MEIQILERRHEWLVAVLATDKDTQLATLLANQSSQGQCDGATESRDMSAVARAGPCAGFEGLKTIAHLESLASMFRTCSSKDQIKSKNEEALPLRKLLQTLMSSCKGALNDLKKAKKKRDDEVEKQREKKLKEAEEAKKKSGSGRKRTGLGIAKHILVNPDNECWSKSTIPVDNHWAGLTLNMRKPFILAQALQGVWETFPELAKEFESFGAVFKDSGIRISEGRAQRALAPELSRTILKACGSVLPSGIFRFDAAEGHEELSKIMSCSTFGIASSHITIGKCELAQFPCLRVAWSGTRVVSVVALDSILSELYSPDSAEHTVQDAQEWLAKAKEGDVQRLVEEGNAWLGTVGPNDILYVPPGALISHKVHASDVVGARLGVLNGDMKNLFDCVATAVPANKAVAQALDMIAKGACPVRIGRRPKAHGAVLAWFNLAGSKVLARGVSVLPGLPELALCLLLPLCLYVLPLARAIAHSCKYKWFSHIASCRRLQ